MAGVKHVIAVEPSPKNILCIKKNLREFIDHSRLTIIPAALMDYDGVVTFSIVKNGIGNSAFHRLDALETDVLETTSL